MTGPVSQLARPAYRNADVEPAKVTWHQVAPSVVPLLVLLSAAIAAGAVLPGWGWMWAIALALFFGCKWLTFWLAQRRLARVRLGRAVGYLLGWVGMNAQVFLNPACRAARPAVKEWLVVMTKTALGCTLLWGLAPMMSDQAALLRAWIGMIGLVLALHFGLFHLLSLAWRQAGVQAPPLMQAPMRATSLSEFWGRRWNAGFHQLTLDFIFRPLVRRTGLTPAMLIAFTISGLIHDLVISLPARAGLGRPTLYFVIQGLGVLVERSRPGRSLSLGQGLRGRLLTTLFLIAPLPLLFHRPFVLNVVLPFLRALSVS